MTSRIPRYALAAFLLLRLSAGWAEEDRADPRSDDSQVASVPAFSAAGFEARAREAEQNADAMNARTAPGGASSDNLPRPIPPKPPVTLQTSSGDQVTIEQIGPMIVFTITDDDGNQIVLSGDVTGDDFAGEAQGNDGLTGPVTGHLTRPDLNSPPEEGTLHLNDDFDLVIRPGRK